MEFKSKSVSLFIILSELFEKVAAYTEAVTFSFYFQRLVEVSRKRLHLLYTFFFRSKPLL